jgi:membrane protease YdiL (CAAX protease family)
VKGLASKHPVAVWFALALGLSWLGWIPYGLSQAGVLPVTVPEEVAMFAQYGPFVATLFLARWLGLPGGAKGVLRAMVRWRVHPGWYLFILAVPIAVASLIVLVHDALGGSVPDPSRLDDWWLRHAQSIRTGGWNVVDVAVKPTFGLKTWLANIAASGPIGAALVWAGMAIGNGGISEEPGWRGVVQPTLQATRTAVRAAVLTGILWGMWHFGPDSWKLLAEGNLFAFALPIGTTMGTIALAILFACVYNNTNGSLLLPILFHAIVNTVYNVFALTWPEVPFTYRYLEFALGYGLLAAVVVSVFGGRLTRHLGQAAAGGGERRST